IGFETKQGRPFGVLGDDGGVPIEIKAAWDRFARSGEYERKAMSMGTGSDGGYAVPKEISQSIEALMLKQSVMRGICLVERSGTADYHKLVNRRGTAASWVGETEARSTSATPQLSDILPPDGELTASPPITQRL